MNILVAGSRRQLIYNIIMYSKRIKIFVILSACVFGVCVVSLMKMQLFSGSYYQERIAELKLQRGYSKPLNTVRGKIIDRNGLVLAVDQPRFQLYIEYSLSRFFDRRVQQAMLLRAGKKDNAVQATADCRSQIADRLEDIEHIIDKCVHFGPTRADIEKRIKQINDDVWNLRSYLTRRRKGLSLADFEKKIADPNERLLSISRSDIAEMHKSYSLVELKTEDDIFTAQLEFMDVEGVSVSAEAHRVYPYGSAACQTIGWVGSAKGEQEKLFAGDKLLRYIDDDVCGRQDGVEYVCEPILRGRRGELVYDIDSQLRCLTETRFGKDVQLTLDIELQQRIESLFSDCQFNENCRSPAAAVVIDIESADILAMVSKPGFDLNDIRSGYPVVSKMTDKPLLNRAINQRYPPGSVIKPVIAVAGLESGQIDADEIISCPAHKTAKGWPNCWIYNRYHVGHDDKWQGQGGNCARNAIKGSCNIYFSRLASKIDSATLQRWLFDFGYGQKPLASVEAIAETAISRNIMQLAGIISSKNPSSKHLVNDFNDILPLKSGDRKWFGIGQGNMRVTPLQVTAAMGCLGRGGVYKSPRLFTETVCSSRPLNISPATLQIIRDGMGAVVGEYEGTAYRQFVHSGFDEQGVTVYGKTGSTEAPDHAWFAGFAEDQTGRAISFAVIIEGGQHGSSDAGPLACQIIQYAIEAGYLGRVKKSSFILADCGFGWRRQKYSPYSE